MEKIIFRRKPKMLKTRKHISMLLVVAMVLSIFAVGAVSFSAASEGGFYIAGSMNGWTPTDGYKLEVNEGAEGVTEYSISGVALTTADQFKVAYSEDGSAFSDWYPDGMGNDFNNTDNGTEGVITEDGTYTVYFRPNGDGGEDWHGDLGKGGSHKGKFIYIVKEEEAQPGDDTPDEPGSGTGVTVDGISYDAHVGDVVNYVFNLNMAGMPTADGGNTGKVDSVQGSIQYDNTKLKIVSDLSKDDDDNYPGTMPNVKGGMIVVNDTGSEIIYTAAKDSGYDFSEEKILIKVDFEVIADGSSEIVNQLQALSSGSVALIDMGPDGVVVTETPSTRATVSVYCPHIQPTEAEPTEEPQMPTEGEPTEEPQIPTEDPEQPTSAPEQPTDAPAPGQSTVTVIGIDGSSTTKYVSVGDEIVVTNYLQVPEGKRVNSINFWQTFNDGDAMLEIVPKVTTSVDEDGQEETITENIQTPRIADPTTNVEGNVIKVNATKAEYKNAYKFPNADSILSITTYKVVAEGNTKIRTDMITLATIANDDSMENQIMEGEKVGSDDIKSDVDVKGGSDTPTDPEQPTTPGEEPTTPGEEPTTPGEEPTDAPVTGVFVKADGVLYKVEKDEIFDYVFYLNVGEKVYSLDAETAYDSTGLSLIIPQVDEDGEMVDDLAAMFPVLKDKATANYKIDGHVYYNFSDAQNGKNFTADDKQLVHLTFKVTADAGIYEINTMLKVIAGENEKKIIFDGERLVDIARAEGLLLDKEPYDGPEPVVPTDAPEQPTDAPELPTEAPVVTPTEAPVVEPTESPVITPTDSEGTTAPTAVPATSPKSTKDSGSSSSNSSTVKTGSTEMAVIFLMILVMAAGVVLYTKKRKFD